MGQHGLEDVAAAAAVWWFMLIFTICLVIPSPCYQTVPRPPPKQQTPGGVFSIRGCSVLGCEASKIEKLKFSTSKSMRIPFKI